MPERITKKIGESFPEVQKFLDKINKDPELMKDFLVNPSSILKKEGIDFKSYGIKDAASKKISTDLATLVYALTKKTVTANSIIAEESISRKTNEGMDTNWDHSEESKTNYDPQTETRPGRSSETKEGSTTGKSSSFDIGGIWLKVNLLRDGPMISPENMRILYNHVVNSTRAASPM